MKTLKRSGLLIVICLISVIYVLAQQKVFISPPSADAMQNPFSDNAVATANGRVTYNTYCVPCHGEKGRGDGIAAAGLPKSPADHTSATVQAQTDGAIFWKIFTGNSPMPSFKSLTQTQIWELVNYIRTLSKAKK